MLHQKITRHKITIPLPLQIHLPRTSVFLISRSSYNYAYNYAYNHKFLKSFKKKGLLKIYTVRCVLAQNANVLEDTELQQTP